MSLKGRDKEEWIEMMHELRNSLDGKIGQRLRVGYVGFDGKDQETFLYIACLLNGHNVDDIRNVLGDSVNIRLKILAKKSFIRISLPRKTVEMHNLLQNFGREIVRAESNYSPGKRRLLLEAEEIRDVFTDNTGTETVLGICFNTSEFDYPLRIDEESQGCGDGGLYLPQGLAYFPRKLRILYWDECPLKCMPSNFKAECLVELTMENSKLETLWEGTQKLRNLKKVNLCYSKNLKEIPDLSYAINLEEMDLFSCKSLVTLPFSIRNL